MGNFEFLKDLDKDLYGIATDAEKLFKDGYFEQCMIQTRRLGECLCRQVMGDSAQPSDTFDNMLATLKDTPQPSEEEKEFLDDMYFLKKSGNLSAHSKKNSNDANAGKTALECLERAFEAAVNVSVFRYNADKSVLNLVFDEELLMTGEKSEAATLQEEYNAKRREAKKISKKEKSDKEEKSAAKPKKKKKSKKTNWELYEDYLEAKKEHSKIFKNKSLLREILETILAGALIYIAYLLFFTH